MQVKRNLIANFAGRAWTALISFIFLPIYVRLLGVESYGLITIFISLNALIQVLDFGLSTTINRELARLTAVEASEREARDLVRTLEAVYWLIGLAIALSMVVAAPWAASHWIHAKGLSPGAITQALALMGLAFAFVWPDSLYAGGMMGLQRQVYMNGIRVVVATVQYVGAALLLTYVSHTIQMFFLWQIVAFAAQTLALRSAVWRFLPSCPHPPGFQKSVWAANWRFAAGMTGLALTSAVLTQLDKVVLSRVLTLEMLGYYGIAMQLAGMLAALTGPILSAVFPSYTQLASQENVTELTLLYHKSCRLLAGLIIPIALTLCLFAPQLLLFYMRDPVRVGHIHTLLSILVIGTALNSLMTLPLGLQLAYGWTNLANYKNIVAVVLFVPSLIWMTTRYGAAGAAIMWIVLNAGYLVFEIPIMHRRLLRGQALSYYVLDVGVPLLISLVLLGASWYALPRAWPLGLQVFWIAVACGLTLATCFAASQQTQKRRAIVKASA